MSDRDYFNIAWLKAEDRWLRDHPEQDEELLAEQRARARDAAAEAASWLPLDDDDLHPIDPHSVRY